MNKDEFYRGYVQPYLTDDAAFNRALFAQAIDGAARDGVITDKQARTWTYPHGRGSNVFMGGRR